MGLISVKDLLTRIRKGPKARAWLVESNLSQEIAFQIRATREAQGMTQAELAEAVGMSQNNLSRLENPDYGKQTISSLKRVAAHLDVAVVVRLVPFSQYIKWLSGTPHLDTGLRPEALAVPNFAHEEKAHCLATVTTDVRYVPVYYGAQRTGFTKVLPRQGNPTSETVQAANSYLLLPDFRRAG